MRGGLEHVRYNVTNLWKGRKKTKIHVTFMKIDSDRMVRCADAAFRGPVARRLNSAPGRRSFRRLSARPAESPLTIMTNQ